MCSIMGYFGSILSDEDRQLFNSGFQKTLSRGPDMSRVIEETNAIQGFHRLSIMGLTESGMQPFEFEGKTLLCNGEIYGFQALKDSLISKGYKFSSDSDCEILLPLYKEYGDKMFNMLDAEFALIIYDKEKKTIIAARDPIGIRPLYYGYTQGEKRIVFASEPKNLVGLVEKILPFPPGSFYKGSISANNASNKEEDASNKKGSVSSKIEGAFIQYEEISSVRSYSKDTEAEVVRKIHDKLVLGVKKRLVSDSPVGFLLSGGLDSSLVCSIATKLLGHPIKTFAIGMAEDAIDLKYAKQVATYLHSEHAQVIITKEDVLNALEEVIYLLGTFDITTIRASVGMYLVCKYIHENTNIKVILTGEISDELFGYKYTDFAPSAEEFQKEAEKRVKELHEYDVLRADRCISVNSLEARVPFGDLDFVRYVMSIEPKLKLNTHNKGKYLLRRAFDKEACKEEYLPYSLLMREKAAFSDAVGHSLVNYIKEYASSYFSDNEAEKGYKRYTHCAPYTKESLLYRTIFEKYYPNQAQMISSFWLPNQNWKGCCVKDPSARVLSNYGASGV